MNKLSPKLKPTIEKVSLSTSLNDSNLSDPCRPDNDEGPVYCNPDNICRPDDVCGPDGVPTGCAPD